MTNEEFKCWVNGYVMLSDELFIIPRQFNIIKNHANLAHAISGYLEDNINEFMRELEKLFLCNAPVAFFEVKSLCEVHLRSSHLVDSFGIS